MQHIHGQQEIQSNDGPSRLFDSGLVIAGNSFEWTPETAEDVPYFCMVHPWMDGLIIVQEAEAEEETMEEEVHEEETMEEEVMDETMEEEVMDETMEEEVMDETMEEEVMDETMEEEVMMEETVEESEGGGCLIATATFGSELAPQVQQLRELRDNTILSTESGTCIYDWI